MRKIKIVTQQGGDKTGLLPTFYLSLTLVYTVTYSKYTKLYSKLTNYNKMTSIIQNMPNKNKPPCLPYLQYHCRVDLESLNKILFQITLQKVYNYEGCNVPICLF